jgi:hypothetical protein
VEHGQQHRSTQLKSVASLADDSSLDLGRAKQCVAVRNARKSPLRRFVSSAVQDQIPRDRVADLLGVNGQHCSFNVLEHAAFNKRLSTHASVDTRRPTVINRVKDVRSTEAEQRHAAVDVLPVVVGVRDAQLALVLGAVAVAVADERGLEMVVKVHV